MSKNDKLLVRLLRQPADFTWDELLRVVALDLRSALGED